MKYGFILSETLMMASSDEKYHIILHRLLSQFLSLGGHARACVRSPPPPPPPLAYLCSMTRLRVTPKPPSSARQVYTRTTRQAHRLYTRAVGGPALAAWIRYLDDTWRQKKRQSAAVVIQRHARGYVVRKGFALSACFFLLLLCRL